MPRENRIREAAFTRNTLAAILLAFFLYTPSEPPVLTLYRNLACRRFCCVIQQCPIALIFSTPVLSPCMKRALCAIARSEMHHSQLRMWQGRTFVLSVVSEYEL
jgi:hypothetical protein